MNIIIKLQGFATNVSGYNQLGSPCPESIDCLKDDSDSCCSNPCSFLAENKHNGTNEQNYACVLREKSKEMMGWTPHMVIDTSRNANENVRKDCANWCNIRNARLGENPTTKTKDPTSVDAYLWMKILPGESDGYTAELPKGMARSEFSTKG